MISLESIELNKKDRGPRYRKHLDDHVMGFDKDYPEYEREFIKRFVSTLPCGECQKHAVAYVEKNEPGFVTQDQYLEYKLELHNYVNEKLDKIKRTKKEYINYLVINYS